MLVMPSAASKGKPDLQVGSISPRSSSVAQGSSLSFADKVVNKGSGRAGPSETRYYLSTDTIRDASDRRLPGRSSVKALDPRATAKGGRSLEVPATVAVGSYYLMACADGAKKVAESNEKNNCRASTSVVNVTPPATDHDLIDRDVAAGRIDEETALTYKVFSDFDDDRLPARYDGDDSLHLESHALSEVAEGWDTLSLETQLKLGPYLLPPFHENSWMDDTPHPEAFQRPAAGSAFEFRCGEGLPMFEQWGHVDAAGGAIRIWWLKDNDATDSARAADMASEIDNVIWPSLTGLMGAARLLPDGGASTTCRGGSDAFDISLVDVKRSITTTLDKCDGTWARTLFQRSLFGGPRPKTMAILAHEIFHAFQFSYDVSVGCLAPGSQYDWLTEGTAQWVEHHVYPGENTEHPFAQRLLHEPGTPIEEGGSWGYHRYYATYLLPFFLETRAGASVVKTMWDNTIGMNSVDAVDAAIPGNFIDSWHDFALYNWNHGPVDEYKQRDGLSTTATVVGSKVIKVGDDTPTVHSAHLAAKYLELRFEPDVAEFEYHNDLAGDPRAGVRAVIYYDDGSTEVKNLSDDAKTVICIDDGTKRVDRLILVYSSSGKTAADDLIFKPKLVGVKGCTCFASGARTAASEGDPAVCEADGTLHYTYTLETSEDPNQELYQTSTESHEGTMTIDLVADEDDPDTYVDKNSSYEYNATRHFDYSRSWGDCHELSDTTHTGSSTFKSHDADASGYLNPDGSFELTLPVFVVDTHTESSITCLGSHSTSDYESRLLARSCPIEGFNFSYRFEEVGETPTTRTYSIDCSDEHAETDGAGVLREETVSVTGTITLPR